MTKAVLAFLLLMFFPVLGFAQTPAKPIAKPALKVENETSGPISKKTITDYYESCLYHIPERFTPRAREYYCACNSASLQENFDMTQFNELQKPSTRKATNKLFEAYVTKAVAPCVDMPVKEIEYLECLLDSALDVRIRNVPAYCSCVGTRVQRHAAKNADTEILTELYKYPLSHSDPVDALWSNQNYISYKANSYDQCIISRNQP